MAGVQLNQKGGHGYAAEIRVVGLSQTMNALKTLEPEVYKRIRKHIRDTVKSLERAATQTRREHMYGAGGLNYKTSVNLLAKRPYGKVEAMMGPQSSNKDWSSPATRSVIFEHAANSSRPATRAAIESYNERYGPPPRFLWPSWEGMRDAAYQVIEQDIRDAEKVVESRMYQIGAFDGS